jgi:hypothetical protein
MPVFTIHNEIQPTYGEWFSLLEEMGYEKKIVDIERPIFKGRTKQYRLENADHKSFIILPIFPDDTPVLKGLFASYSIQLYWEGVIKDMQDMAKMIEKKRLALRNQTAFSA